MISELLCPPDPKEVEECAICHNEIYTDEEYYLMDDGCIVCSECLAEWASKFATVMCNGQEVDR